MAGFLVVAGLTGALLAGYHAFDAALNPALLRVAPPAPGAQPLDPLLLRERVQAQYPQALVHQAPLQHLPGESAVFWLRPMRDAATGAALPLPQDEVFIDPYTGRWLGHRHWGAFDAGWRHVMPMVYRLHMDLGLGPFGQHLFGIVALAWTLDCFIGAWLTLPKRRRATPTLGAQPADPEAQAPRGWWARWWRAWVLRPGGSAIRLVFDLHRAGGLWPWALLFVFAWSSVAFNLGEVYEPVMKAVLPSQDLPSPVERKTRSDAPAMPWPQALATGRRLMADYATEAGFHVQREHRLSLDTRRGLYQYRVQSNRELRLRRAATMLSFDATSGELVSRYLPTGAAAGDTATSWFVSLHLADLGGWAGSWASGWPLQVLVAAIGLVVVMLSGTGVWLWWRRRVARRAGARAPELLGIPPTRT